MALTEWSTFIANAPDKGLQAPPVLLAVKGQGTNNVYLLEADQVGGGLPFSFAQATTPAIINVTIPLANTEVTIPLPAGCRKFTIKLRGNADLKLSYAAGLSGTTFVTIPRGTIYSEQDFILAAGSLYVQSPVASQVVELITWT